MSANRSDLMPNIVVLPIGTQAASIVLPGVRLKRHSLIKSVSLINQAGLAADNTNFLQVQLQDLAGNTIASVDSRAANQGALTANTPVDAALSAAGAVALTQHNELDVPAATDLKINVVKNGTGVPTLAVLCVEWYPA